MNIRLEEWRPLVGKSKKWKRDKAWEFIEIPFAFVFLLLRILLVVGVCMRAKSVLKPY